MHDYVPLYFSSLSVMLLAVLNKKNVDQFNIVYFEFPIEIVGLPHSVFTDSAANRNDPPNFYDDPTDLTKLNWQAIDSKKWSSLNDTLKKQRMAELLVYKELDWKLATNIVVWNDEVKQEVLKNSQEAGVRLEDIKERISFENSHLRPHYFCDFQNNSKTSVSMGPLEILMELNNAIEELRSRRNGGNPNSPPFDDLSHLFNSLSQNFCCLDCTEDLFNVHMEYGHHNINVAEHTLTVVSNLSTSPFWRHLSENEIMLVTLAAFFHDIGKGPSIRWENGKMTHVDLRHPIRGLALVVEIFGTMVHNLDLQGGATILRLIAYHDLIGDIFFKGRLESQLKNAVQSKSELLMLFILGRADSLALNDNWDDKFALELFIKYQHEFPEIGTIFP